jgi:atrophin-1 interacting protein 5 (WW domain-containing E3 ubiquitin protein ligase 1)
MVSGMSCRFLCHVVLTTPAVILCHQVFDEREVDILLQGLSEFDMDDWKKNTLYRTYSADSKQIVWFWELVDSLSDEKRARLLQFVTG